MKRHGLRAARSDVAVASPRRTHIRAAAAGEAIPTRAYDDARSIAGEANPRPHAAAVSI